jgi:hypothetical protein
MTHDDPRSSSTRWKASALFALAVLPAAGGCTLVPALVASGTGAASASSSSATPSDPPAASSSKAASASAKAAPEPEADITAPKGMPDLATLIGPRKDGWAPTLLASFDRGMTPEAAGKLMPGAEKKNEFGISRVTRKDLPGVSKVEFHYLQDEKSGKWELHSIEILFSPSLKQAEFYEYLLKVATNKYGPAEPDDVAKKLVLWMNSDYASAGVQFVSDRYKFIWTPPH